MRRTSDAPDRFWAFGCQEHESALTERYGAVLADLRGQIAAATGAEKMTLEVKLAEVEAVYRRKLENVGRSLF